MAQPFYDVSKDGAPPGYQQQGMYPPHQQQQQPPPQGAYPPGAYAGPAAAYAPGFAPPGYGMANPIQMPQIQAIAPNLMSTLAAVRGLYIKQDISWVEQLTGCDTQNKYQVSAWDPERSAAAEAADGLAKDGIVSEPLLKFAEKSNWCLRQLLKAGRGFHMAAFPISPRIGTFAMPLREQPFAPMDWPDTLVFERPFKCTMACFFRPRLRVRSNAMGYIGEAYSPFTCMNPIIHVRPPTELPADAPANVAAEVTAELGKTWYVVRGECCQWGLHAAMLPFSNCCKKVSFYIYDPRDTSFSTPLGEIARVFGGCCREALTVADSFTITFPQNADPIKRATLLGAVMLLEYMLFVKEPGNQASQAENATDGACAILGCLVRALV